MAVEVNNRPTEHEVVDQFAEAMRAHGFEIDKPIVSDGRYHRFHIVGDRARSRNGWAILNIDERPRGTFGSWKTGEKFTWSLKGARPLSAFERTQLRQRAQMRAAQCNAATELLHLSAAKRAAELHAHAELVETHPYLDFKGVPSNPRLRTADWHRIDEETGELLLIAKDALLVPLMDFRGQVHNVQAIFGDGQSGYTKLFMKGGAKQGYFLSLAKPTDNVVLICEGLATGLSLWKCTGHCVLVAFDAGNLVHVARELRRYKTDARILVCADNDQWTDKPVKNPGIFYATEAARVVAGNVVYPDFQDTSSKPTDFNDLHQLQGELTVQQTIAIALRSMLAETTEEEARADHNSIPEEPGEMTERPQILIAGGCRHLMVDRAEEIMARRDDIFTNAGRLVRVAEAKDIGENVDTKTKDGRQHFTDSRRILMKSVAKEWLTTELTREIEWVKSDARKKDGYVTRDAPDFLAPALIEQKVWPNIRELAGITSAPILREDGSVRLEAGYDPETGMLLVPRGPFLPVADKPTLGDAINALQILKTPFQHYTFATDAGLASALSIILSRLARHLMPLVPFHLITAPGAGSGKGYIIQVASIICDGVQASLRPWQKNEDELRKLLTSSVMASHGVICFDNIENGLVINSSTLDSFLTAPVWEDRVLGVNKIIQATNCLVLAGTGNNVQFAQDSIRRAVVARVLTESETPWHRKFEWTPPEYARCHRAEMLQAACTLLSAFIQASEPAPSGTVPLGSFERWSQLVRNALMWVGLSDPCATQAEFVASDPERLKLSELLTALRKVFCDTRFSASDVLSAEDTAIRKLLNVLFHDERGNAERANPQRIGRFFSKFRDSPVDGLRISSEFDRGLKTHRWFVKENSEVYG
jgi:phage/plasmid primase-like uncharacterized protein